MIRDSLYQIAYRATSHNLNFTQTLMYEREQCAAWGIPYNRHTKRRLDAIKRKIMDSWEKQ